MSTQDSAMEGELERYLGTTIRELRRAHGLTIADISDRADISRGMLSRIENGQTATSLDALSRIARALDRVARFHRVQEGNPRVRETAADEFDLALGSGIKAAHAAFPERVEDVRGRIGFHGIEGLGRELLNEPAGSRGHALRAKTIHRQFRLNRTHDIIRGRVSVHDT